MSARTIAAKPTLYRGVAFRSRLEARWAVAFDDLGVEWQYEPRIMRAGPDSYTPDFILDEGLYAEVKPRTSSTNLPYRRKLLRAVTDNPKSFQFHEMVTTGLVLLGDIPRITKPDDRDGVFWVVVGIKKDGQIGASVATVKKGCFDVWDPPIEFQDHHLRWEPIRPPASQERMSDLEAHAYQKAALASLDDF